MTDRHYDPDARLSSADNRLLERALDQLAVQLEHERQRTDRADQRETATAARAERAEQRADEAIARVERAEKRLEELLARQTAPESPPILMQPSGDADSPSILVQRISDAPLGLTVPDSSPERRHWRAGAIVVVLLVICAALVFVVGSR